MGYSWIISFSRKNLFPILTFLLILGLYLPALIFFDTPSRDVALRYAPAADAFALGEWKYAFHPRFQMLHQFFSGLFTVIFQTDGFTGTKISSLFFYALGVFPFFALMKEVFNGKIAKWSLLFYLFASRLLILAYEGLRESHKLFVILLLTLGLVWIVKNSRSLRGYLLAGISAGLACCTRNDLILFSMILLLIGGILDCYRNVICWRTLIMLAAAMIFSIPEFYVNYTLTGCWIPGTRFYYFFKMLLKTEPFIGEVLLHLYSGAIFLYFGICCGSAYILKRKHGKYYITAAGTVLLIWQCCYMAGLDLQKNENDFFDFLDAVFRGSFPFFFLTALPGLLYRIVRRKMTVYEWLLCGIYVFHGISLVLQIFLADNYLYVSYRYLLPAAPLYFGWIPFSWLLLIRLLGKCGPLAPRKKQIACGLLIIFLGAAFADANSKAADLYLPGKDKEKRKLVSEISELVKKDYRGTSRWHVPFVLHEYFSNRNPRILFFGEQKFSVAAYLAGGSSHSNPWTAHYAVYPAGDRTPEIYGYVKLGLPLKDRHGKNKLQVWKRL